MKKVRIKAEDKLLLWLGGFFLIALLVAAILAIHLNVVTVKGSFQIHEPLVLTDTEGNENSYYQFRSYDDEVWWLLTEQEIGHIPNGTDEYRLTFSNSGTFSCDCKAEYDCECYLYDDVFLCIKKS